MKRFLSPTTQSALGELYKGRSIWDKVAGRYENWLRTLDDVRLAAEPIAALDLFPLILSTDTTVSVAAANVVVDLLRLVPNEELPWLDEMARGRSQYYPEHRTPWSEIRPLDVGRLDAFGQRAVILFGVASFHSNGFVRQAAVEHLARCETGEELPFLLIRLNDWVDNVRLVAGSAVEARLRPEYASAVVDALPLVVRLTRVTRSNQHAVVSLVEDLLARRESQDAVARGLESASPVVRRLCYRALSVTANGDLPRLLMRALGDTDVVVRTWAVESIAAVPQAAAQRDLYRKSLHDSLGRIRRLALQYLTKAFPVDAQKALRDALLDGSPAVRSEARSQLQSATDFDATQFYRDRLRDASTPQLRNAIEALGEVGTLEDATTLLLYSRHESVAVRGAAVKAIGKLAGDRYTHELLAALVDPAPSVSRRARDALERHTRLIDPARLWSKMNVANPFFVRRNVLALITRLPKWESIFYILQATADPDAAIARSALRAVDRWNARFNKSFVTPRPEQVARIHDALQKHRFALGRSTTRELEFTVNMFGS